MAHPYAGKASTGRDRAKSIGKGYNVGGSVGKAATANVAKYAGGGKAIADLKPSGYASGGRLDKYARGGRTRKGKHGTHINIVNVAPGKDKDGAAPGGLPPGGPPMMPPPIMPKPPAGGLPGGPAGLPPTGGPPGLPPGLGAGPPGMPPKPPGMMKRGGKVKAFARGGFTGGAETGVGRLEKTSHAKRRKGR